MGTVAFEAVLDAGGNGIFLGPDAAADRVIQTGDDLFGFQVTSVSLGGMNDAGQIVFHAFTAGGGQGIYVATPVPEPSSFILGCLGIGFLAFARCRH